MQLKNSSDTMVIGRLYETRRTFRLKPEHGHGQFSYIVKNNIIVTVVDVQYIGPGKPEKWSSPRDFYKVAILVDNKVWWFRQIDHAKFSQRLRLIENEN